MFMKGMWQSISWVWDMGNKDGQNLYTVLKPVSANTFIVTGTRWKPVKLLKKHLKVSWNPWKHFSLINFFTSISAKVIISQIKRFLIENIESLAFCTKINPMAGVNYIFCADKKQTEDNDSLPF